MKLIASKEYILFLFLILLSYFLVLAPTPIVAQDQSRPEKHKKDDDLIRCPVHLVLVTVVVRDGNGKEVTDLRKDDFTVHEDGAKKVIDFWHRRETSTSRESSIRYEIGYYPVDELLDDSKRRIKVEVASRGKVKYKVQIIANEESGKGDRQ